MYMATKSTPSRTSTYERPFTCKGNCLVYSSAPVQLCDESWSEYVNWLWMAKTFGLYIDVVFCDTWGVQCNCHTYWTLAVVRK